MPEVIRYEYQNAATIAGQVVADRLQAEIASAGIVGCTGVYTSFPNFFIGFDRNLTASQKTQLDGVVAAHDGRPRKLRTLFAIRADLNALTAARKTAVWNDINSGSPPKWALDVGVNAGAISAIEWGATTAGGTVAVQTEARLRLVAMFCQDNPRYLVNPAFDSSINIAGDEVAA